MLRSRSEPVLRRAQLYLRCLIVNRDYYIARPILPVLLPQLFCSPPVQTIFPFEVSNWMRVSPAVGVEVVRFLVCFGD